MMDKMGIADYRTYNKYVQGIGKPTNGAYTLKQVVQIVTKYDYLFKEPLELEESTVIYSNHLQSIDILKNLL